MELKIDDVYVRHPSLRSDEPEDPLRCVTERRVEQVQHSSIGRAPNGHPTDDEAVRILEILHQNRDQFIEAATTARFPDGNFWASCNETFHETSNRRIFSKWSDLKKWLNQYIDRRRAELPPRHLSSNTKHDLMGQWDWYRKQWRCFKAAEEFHEALVDAHGHEKLRKCIRKGHHFTDHETNYMSYIFNKDIWAMSQRRRLRLQEPFHKTRQWSHNPGESDSEDSVFPDQEDDTTNDSRSLSLDTNPLVSIEDEQPGEVVSGQNDDKNDDESADLVAAQPKLTLDTDPSLDLDKLLPLIEEVLIRHNVFPKTRKVQLSRESSSHAIARSEAGNSTKLVEVSRPAAPGQPGLIDTELAPGLHERLEQSMLSGQLFKENASVGGVHDHNRPLAPPSPTPGAKNAQGNKSPLARLLSPNSCSRKNILSRPFASISNASAKLTVTSTEALSSTPPTDSVRQSPCSLPAEPKMEPLPQNVCPNIEEPCPQLFEVCEASAQEDACPQNSDTIEPAREPARGGTAPITNPENERRAWKRSPRSRDQWVSSVNILRASTLPYKFHDNNDTDGVLGRSTAIDVNSNLAPSPGVQFSGIFPGPSRRDERHFQFAGKHTKFTDDSNGEPVLRSKGIKRCTELPHGECDDSWHQPGIESGSKAFGGNTLYGQATIQKRCKRKAASRIARTPVTDDDTDKELPPLSKISLLNRCSNSKPQQQSHLGNHANIVDDVVPNGSLSGSFISDGKHIITSTSKLTRQPVVRDSQCLSSSGSTTYPPAICDTQPELNGYGGATGEYGDKQSPGYSSRNRSGGSGGKVLQDASPSGYKISGDDHSWSQDVQSPSSWSSHDTADPNPVICMETTYQIPHLFDKSPPYNNTGSRSIGYPTHERNGNSPRPKNNMTVDAHSPGPRTPTTTRTESTHRSDTKKQYHRRTRSRRGTQGRSLGGNTPQRPWNPSSSLVQKGRFDRSMTEDTEAAFSKASSGTRHVWRKYIKMQNRVQFLEEKVEKLASGN